MTKLKSIPATVLTLCTLLASAPADSADRETPSEQASYVQSAKAKYVGVTAARRSERVVRLYRIAEDGTVEIRDNGGSGGTDWQPIGVPRRAKQKCIGIACVRISPQVVRLYRAFSDGSLHILDDGGNPKSNDWQPIGVNPPGRRGKYVGVAAVRISQRVVRVYRTLEDGNVEILDDGGNPKATWQPLHK